MHLGRLLSPRLTPTLDAHHQSRRLGLNALGLGGGMSRGRNSLHKASLLKKRETLQIHTYVCMYVSICTYIYISSEKEIHVQINIMYMIL